MLHDVIKDSSATEEELRGMFDDEVLDAAMLLIKSEDMTHKEYVDRLLESNNISALRVEKAGIENNINLSRLGRIATEDMERLENKYIPIYYKIYNKLRELESA